MAEEQQTAWKAEGDPDKGTVKITGEVDFTNSLDVREWFRDFSERSRGDLEVDLADLSYIDSSGLAVLIEVRKHLKAMERAIRVVAVSSQVQKLFTLTQIGDLFGL